MATPSSKTQKLSGNMNSSDIYLTLRNTSSILVSGNVNSIRINVIDVKCPHGANCSSEKPTDSLEVSGNCNMYTFHCTSYGVAPEELVQVTGNMNRVKTGTKESIECKCNGPSGTIDDSQSRPITDAGPASLESGRAQDDPHGQPPPAYEPPRRETPPEASDTKVLLASSISSLDALDERDSLEDLRS